MNWSPPMILPVKSGRLYQISATFTLPSGTSVDPDPIERAANKRLLREAGAERAAWGRVSYKFIRHSLERIDVVIVSAAVVVNTGEQHETA